MTVKIFFCYAHEDEALLNKLKLHLRPLQRQGIIDVWNDRDISAGTEWEPAIKEQLNTAQIILLLVSPDFMDSDYCYSIEMKRAIERHELGEARVIPVILRSVYWQGVLGKLQALPTDGKPVKSWPDLDEAFFNVEEGIRKAVKDYEYSIPAAIKARKFRFHSFEYEIEHPAKSHKIRDINPGIVARGKRLVLWYHISNDLDIEVPIWLGANLYIDGQYYYNINEDADVILQPGDHTYKRLLTIGRDCTPRSYYLLAAIWHGTRSNPGKSLNLADVWQHPSLLEIT